MIWKEEDLPKIREMRQRARTDLIWFAQNVLGYDRVDRRIHGPMVDTLVQFDGLKGTDKLSIDENGQLQAEWCPDERDPAEALAHVPKKKCLIMDPRSWFKTTLNCIAHSIQILLNFPDVGIAIIHANSDAAADIVGNSIKPHFINNAKMRWLFPEFCTEWNARTEQYSNSGNMSRFTTRARVKPFPMPSFYALGANSALASKHFHWIKFTDIVNEKNALSPDQLAKVTHMFVMSDNLLIDPRYFTDVEGTCYSYVDTYNEHIVEKELKLPEAQREFRIFMRGCFVRKNPDGGKESFTPEERDWPFLIQCPEHSAEQGQGHEDERCSICGSPLLPVSRWPEAWSVQDLLKKRRADNWIFNCQQLNDPAASGDEGKAFPLSSMVWTPEKAIEQIKFRYFSMSVDLAETITARADYTAMAVVGWDQAGRGYVVDALMDRWLPSDAVDTIFAMYFKWKCRYLRIEESSFNRGLFPSMEKKQIETGQTIFFDWIKRDPGETKKERINSLQPFWNSGSLRFSESLNPYIQDQLKKQFTQHPAGKDDLLDAIADQFQGKTDFARVNMREDQAEYQKRAMKALLFDRAAWMREFSAAQPESNNNPLGLL